MLYESLADALRRCGTAQARVGLTIAIEVPARVPKKGATQDNNPLPWLGIGPSQDGPGQARQPAHY